MSIDGVHAAREKLQAIGQEHLLHFWNDITHKEQRQLLSRIEQLDSDLFRVQRSLVTESDKHSSGALSPFDEYAKSGSKQNKALGYQLMAEGKIGCLIVAGGQGSRLRFDGPKGLFPITPIKHKSLFQLFAEKTLAAGLLTRCELPLAVMTSPANHKATINAFEERNYFGLNKNQISFFSQGMLPLLNTKGNLFLETPSLISEGPDGNGRALKHFVEQGIWEKWKQQGVRYIVFVQVDNALADPFDAELIGFHQREHADIVVKCVERLNVDEKVGILVRQGQEVRIVEYSEVPEEEFKAVRNDGSLKYPLANISQFSFSMDFVQHAAIEYEGQIPLHKAFKAVKYLAEDGITRMAAAPMAWKFEKFIFDLIPFAQNVKAMLCLRNECFAPLKNAEGPDSIAAVQRALQEHDRDIFFKVSGKEAPKRPFELSPAFYYPTTGLYEKWKGRVLPNVDYVEG